MSAFVFFDFFLDLDVYFHDIHILFFLSYLPSYIICFKITDLLYYLILINISIIKTSNFLKEYKLYITKLYNI